MRLYGIRCFVVSVLEFSILLGHRINLRSYSASSMAEAIANSRIL